MINCLQGGRYRYVSPSAKPVRVPFGPGIGLYEAISKCFDLRMRSESRRPCH